MTGQGSFWFGGTEFYPETINQSLRFEDGDNSRLSTTWGSAGNRKIWTLSWWMKRSNLGEKTIFSSPKSASENGFTVYFPDDKLEIFEYKNTSRTSTFGATTDMVFRDTTNWYHCVLYWQTDTYSSDADSVRLYVNGSQVTLNFRNDGVGEDYESLWWNNTYTQYIGGQRANSQNFDGYIAEVNFIDGQALTADSFGETKNGVWIPKAYTGSYGTNGFRFTFADSTDIGNNANTTDGTNDFSVANLDSSDVVLDSPTNNFATWNLLFEGGEQSSSIYANSTLSEGNLQVSVPTNSYMGSTFRPTSGKWYAEIRVKTIGSTNGEIDWGWLQATTYSGTSGHSGVANKWGAYYHAYSTDHIRLYDETSQLGSNINLTISAGDILQLAWDIDNNKGWVGINNTYYRTDASDGNPSAGTNETFTFTDDEAQNLQVYIANGTSTDVHVANFGQDGTFAGNLTGGDVGTNTDATGRGAFKYAPPTGFLACCSANLPNVEIGPNSSTQADDHFDTDTYSGSASNLTRTLNFQADWMWFKERTTDGIDHNLFDSSRLHSTSNAKFGEKLESNTTDVAADSTAIVSQSTNDITLLGGVSTVNDQYSRTYVNWHWKANGGTTSSNTNGSITSTVQANTTAGFSIVLYTGNNGSSGTVGHGLKFAPEWVLVFGRNVSNSQMLGVTPIGFTKYASFQTTGGYFVADSDIWNDTAPTTTVFSVGGAANVNDSYNYVAYCFHSVEGYSKIGTYAGNGNTSSDGPYVHLGFRPSWLFVKRTNNTGGAIIWDNKRSTFNPTDDYLVPQSSDNEDENSSTQRVDFLSTGFKVKNGATSNSINGSGSTYLYLAFAEQPFKFSNAR